MARPGPAARQPGESQQDYRDRRRAEQKALKAKLKGKPAFKWKGKQTVKGVVRKPYVKRERIVLPSGAVVYREVY